MAVYIREIGLSNLRENSRADLDRVQELTNLRVNVTTQEIEGAAGHAVVGNPLRCAGGIRSRAGELQ
ncbi:hypothetical protein QPK87_28540 [Kamptonema cortianum]|nr:hypothetical protein [Kamptonema cortianum]